MISILTNEDNQKLVACRNCEWRGPANTARLEIKDLDERILPGEEVPVAECPECRALCHYVKDPDDEMASGLAHVAWTTGDVQSLFDVDDRAAKEFLNRNAERIRERLIEFGWGVLDDLGRTARLPLAKDDDDDEE